MRKIILFSFCVFLFPLFAHAAFGDTTTYVSRVYYGDNKKAKNAYFDFFEDIAVTKKGGFVIADTYNNVIRRIKPKGKVKTVAGTGSYGDTIGKKGKAEFALPAGVAVKDKNIYVADKENGKIKKIRKGKVKTLVEGLNNPEGVAIHNSTVYFLDTGNNALKKVSKKGGTVTTITSSLSDPKKLDITSNGKYAYVANAGTYQIKRVDLSSGAVNTVAGSGKEGKKNGSCSEAKFNQVWGVHVYDDDTLFVSDGDGFTDMVRKVDLTGCTVETFASDDNMASINFPRGLTTYDGKLYVAATGIGIIQWYNLDDPNENGLYAGKNRFNVKKKKPVLIGNPKFLVLSKNKKYIFFSENNRIRKIRRGKLKNSYLVAGSVVDNYNKNDNKSYVGNEARFSDVTSIALSKNGKKLYAVDRNNNRIREVVIKTKSVSYLTGAGEDNLRADENNGFGNGSACPNEKDKNVSGCAYFNRPTGSVLSKNGKYLYVADSGNNRIRKVVVKGKNKGKVTTIAGNGTAGYVDATGTDAQFNAPIGITRSKTGRVLYVADRDNHAIRKINLSNNKVTTYVGTGSNGYLDAKLDTAILSYPEWITRGKDGNLYFSEVGSHRIRMVDRSAGVTKLVSGSGERGFRNGRKDVAEFNNPRGLLGLKNKLLVAELYNDQIRSIDISSDAPYTDPAPAVSAVSPNAIAKEWFSGSTASVEVHGTNFRHGATAYIGSHEAVNTYIQSSTSLTIEMPISQMSSGYYTIRIENSDGQYDDIIRGLSVSHNGSVADRDFWP